jgi:plastocyanin
MSRFAFALAAVVLLAAGTPAPADEPVSLSIVIKDHKFQPEELKVPAGKVIELTIDNQDATPEEFESKTLKVEKIVPGNSKGKVRFGPLSAGAYTFVGEFNEATARGAVTAE